MANRETWGVVLVHGVGDTAPGASLEAFLKNLLGERKTLKEDGPARQWLLAEPPPRLPRPTELQPPPYSDETLDETASRFPSHVRTFANSAPGQPERVAFAEVFWADLSRAGTSRLEVLRRVIGLIFDLRHVSDVAGAYPGLKPARTLRLSLYGVSWMLCGPIAGFTAFILALLLARYVGVSLHELAFKAPPPPDLGEWAILLFSIAASIALAWFAHWRKRSAWAADGAWTLFSSWAIAAAAVTAATAVVRRWLDPRFPWDGWFGDWLVQRLVLNSAPDSTMATHLVILLGLAYAAFALLALACTASAILWFAARVQAARTKAREAIPPMDAALSVSYLQVLLWVILGTALGSVVVDRFVPQHRDTVETVALGFTLALGIAFVVTACALLVFVRRKLWVRAGQWESPPGIPRLLLNGIVIAALIALSLASVLVFAWAFITGDMTLYHQLEFLAAYAKPAGAVLAAAVGLPFVFDGVRNALHILIDITSHFYRPRVRPLGNVAPAQFSVQQRIEGRLRRVLQEVLASGEVTHLTVVAHSQGTVIALDVLWLEWARNLLAGRKVSFVTMGSPITHLYGHYFPHRYPPLFADGKLNPAWGQWLDVTVQKWLNIYRVDDYIGTFVDGAPSFPENRRMRKDGGHTGYWGDSEARDLMLQAGVLPG